MQVKNEDAVSLFKQDGVQYYRFYVEGEFKDFEREEVDSDTSVLNEKEKYLYGLLKCHTGELEYFDEIIENSPDY